MWHLAEFNVARARFPFDDPRMSQFLSQLDPVNARAESAEGFVWRLRAPEGTPGGYVTMEDDPLLIVNLSVWTSVETLHAYTYRSAHAAVYRDRQRWFEAPRASPFALWWIQAGTTPTIDEGHTRLALLHRIGPSAEAFTFKSRFPPR